MNLDKIRQLVVHFACRFPLKTDIQPAEREIIKNTLKDLDAEHFHIMGNNILLPQSEPVLFGAYRQYPIGSATATAPSFLFTQNALSVMYLVKMGDNHFARSKTIQAEELNQKAKTILFKIQDVVKNLGFSRAGKIYEFGLGPYSCDKKPALLKKLFTSPSNDIGEFQLVFSKIVNGGTDKFNIRTQIQFQQTNLEDSFMVNLKIDINNRKLAISLDPRDVDKIWTHADSLIENHLGEIWPSEEM